MDLNGRTALITGAARRVGRALALGLAASGVDLLLHYHQSQADAQALAAEIQAMGRKVTLIRADLAQAEGIEALCSEALLAGPVDIVIHSASLYRRVPLAEVTGEWFDACWNVHVRAAMRMAQTLGIAMKQRGSGQIVHIVDAGIRRPYAGFVPYFAAKEALHSLTRTLAIELGPEVRVNSVAPGTVLPPDDVSPSYTEALARQSPLRRVGTPESVADMMLAVLRNDFVTGGFFPVDGGACL